MGLNKDTFKAADILMPAAEASDKFSMEKWAVIACDQYTSQPEYWQRVREYVGDAPSALHMILPEVELSGAYEERIGQINRTMEDYEKMGMFRVYEKAYVYVERTLTDGKIRKGLIGMVDLEDYDYSSDAVSNIRATEKTVVERIPPRKKIRENASVELPHILMLCDDQERLLIEPVAENKNSLPLLYDFELMEGGGRIRGWLLQGEAAEGFEKNMLQYASAAEHKYEDLQGTPMMFAVGDGNHSLATAKACYEELKAKEPDRDFSAHPARYALVELENIHDEAQQFEPIHRIVKGTDVKKLLKAAEEKICVPDNTPGAYPVTWHSGNESETLWLDQEKGQLPVGILQAFLDEYLEENSGEIDYIHGDDTLICLAKETDAVGFLLPAMGKGQLFRGIIADGVLPRKTFSMGHANEKRYYLEGRKIRE